MVSCVGNNSPNKKGMLQGEFVPIPFDDFDEVHQSRESLNQHKWVRRAVLGSELSSSTGEPWCAGEQTHRDDLAPTHNLGTGFMLYEGEISCQDAAELPEHTIQTNGSNFELSHQPLDTALPVNGQPYLSIKGGASSGSFSNTATQGQHPMAHDYAATTDCILQNLTMTIGNPSAQCFANAPWRAFTWTCALLQETSTQPWGTLQEAVQESLDRAEHVELQQLPGLHDLWKQHDLNLQGDANHFVNSLWLHSQTRAFHYRYAEIKENGYLVDHVQMPILVPYPDDWPDQDLINNWANQGMGQYLMDDKRVLICHVTRNTCVDGIATKHNKPFISIHMGISRSHDPWMALREPQLNLSLQSSSAIEARHTPQGTTLQFSSTETCCGWQMTARSQHTCLS